MWRACCFVAPYDAADAADAGARPSVARASAVATAAAADPSPLSSASPFLHAHHHAHARATVAAAAAPPGSGTGGLRAALLHKKAAAAAVAPSAASAFLPNPGEAQAYEALASSSAVKVAVIVRPLLRGERAAGAAEVVAVRHPSTVSLPAASAEPGGAPSASSSAPAGGATTTTAAAAATTAAAAASGEVLYAFDRAYRAELGSGAALKALHEECARPVIDRFCRGFNGTIMAYGQTGGGKTFAMGTMGGGGAAAAQAAQQAAAQQAAAQQQAAAASAAAGGPANSPTLARGNGTPSASHNNHNNPTPGSKTRRRRPLDPSEAAAASAASAAANDAAEDEDEALLAAACSAQHGLIPRALHRVFDYAARAAEEGTYDVRITVSYVQVLNDAVLCLIGGEGAAGAGAAGAADAPPLPAPCSPAAAAAAASATTAPAQNAPNAPNPLNLPAVTLRETRAGEIVLEGAADVAVATRQEVLSLLALGNARRATAPHLLNAESSRSHAVLTLTMSQRARPGASRELPRELRALRSKLRLVDLAGSERSKQTGSRGARFAEGVAINRGLLALGNVINALAAPEVVGADSVGGAGAAAASPGVAGGGGGGGRRRGKQLEQQQQQQQHQPPQHQPQPNPQQQQQQHVPYRDSKLTRLLQDSLGGNSETLLVACVAPSLAALDCSRGTLRYASRARRIRNRLSLGSVAAGNSGGGGGGTMSLAEEEALRGHVRRLEGENARLRGALARAGLAAEAT